MTGSSEYVFKNYNTDHFNPLCSNKMVFHEASGIDGPYIFCDKETCVDYLYEEDDDCDHTWKPIKYYPEAEWELRQIWTSGLSWNYQTDYYNRFFILDSSGNKRGDNTLYRTISPVIAPCVTGIRPDHGDKIDDCPVVPINFVDGTVGTSFIYVSGIINYVSDSGGDFPIYDISITHEGGPVQSFHTATRYGFHQCRSEYILAEDIHNGSVTISNDLEHDFEFNDPYECVTGRSDINNTIEWRVLGTDTSSFPISGILTIKDVYLNTSLEGTPAIDAYVQVTGIGNGGLSDGAWYGYSSAMFGSISGPINISEISPGGQYYSRSVCNTSGMFADDITNLEYYYEEDGDYDTDGLMDLLDLPIGCVNVGSLQWNLGQVIHSFNFEGGEMYSDSSIEHYSDHGRNYSYRISKVTPIQQTIKRVVTMLADCQEPLYSFGGDFDGPAGYSGLEIYFTYVPNVNRPYSACGINIDPPFGTTGGVLADGTNNKNLCESRFNIGFEQQAAPANGPSPIGSGSWYEMNLGTSTGPGLGMNGYNTIGSDGISWGASNPRGIGLSYDIEVLIIYDNCGPDVFNDEGTRIVATVNDNIAGTGTDYNLLACTGEGIIFENLGGGSDINEEDSSSYSCLFSPTYNLCTWEAELLETNCSPSVSPVGTLLFSINNEWARYLPTINDDPNLNTWASPDENYATQLCYELVDSGDKRLELGGTFEMSNLSFQTYEDYPILWEAIHPSAIEYDASSCVGYDGMECCTDWTDLRVYATPGACDLVGGVFDPGEFWNGAITYIEGSGTYPPSYSVPNVSGKLTHFCRILTNPPLIPSGFITGQKTFVWSEDAKWFQPNSCSDLVWDSSESDYVFTSLESKSNFPYFGGSPAFAGLCPTEVKGSGC